MPREDRGSAESRGAVPRMPRMTYRGKESRDCGNKRDCDEGSDPVEIVVSTTGSVTDLIGKSMSDHGSELAIARGAFGCKF